MPIAARAITRPPIRAVVHQTTIADELILAGASIFHGIDPRAVPALVRRMQPLDFPQGSTVFAEGEPGDRLFVILSGKVKIERHASGGRENLLTILGAPDMFGELSLFDPGPRTASAITLTHMRAVSMDRVALQAWLADGPQLTEHLLRMMAIRSRCAYIELAGVMGTDVPGLVARQLLVLAKHFGVRQGNALWVTHDLTQQDIADLVGSCRETVGKTLADFADRGWIRVRGRSLLIIDPLRLANRVTQVANNTSAESAPPPLVA